MGKLDGKIAIIAGGTGGVGEGIVRMFLREGATVIVPSRSQDAIDRLRAYLGTDGDDRLTTLVGNLGEVDDAARLRDEIVGRFAHVDAVVASLGGTWDGKLPLVDVPIETWRGYGESNLTPHYVAARTFLPLLIDRSGASYTLMGGISAVRTIPRYSVVAINSAAQLMMARYLIDETRGAKVRVNQVMFATIHTRDRAAYARPEWVTADEVGAFCAYLASSEAAMINGGILELADRPPPRP
jgi:3-oxoacyl-[acyl-carrier protein] reductase